MLGDELLKDLIEGLSTVPLGNTAVESDILGEFKQAPAEARVAEDHLRRVLVGDGWLE